MASIQDMVRFEKEAPHGIIRLVKCGEFYRAYNHSAWLFHTCVIEYKVIRKYVKALSEDVYYVGFPEKSLFNNIGDRKSEKTEYGFDIMLNLEEIPEESGFQQWIHSVATQQSSKSDFFAISPNDTELEREVVRKLKEFPIESKSMIECTFFLSELRKLLHTGRQ